MKDRIITLNENDEVVNIFEVMKYWDEKIKEYNTVNKNIHIDFNFEVKYI